MVKNNIKKYEFPFHADPFPKTEQFILASDIPKVEMDVIEEFMKWVAASSNPDVINWRKTGEGFETVRKQWDLYKYPRKFHKSIDK